MNLVEGWKKQCATLTVQNDALREENEKLKGYETRAVELQDELRKAKEENQGLSTDKAAIDAQRAKLAKYDLMCAKAVEEATRQYVRAKYDKLMSGAEDAERERLTKLNDYDAIREWGELYRSQARERELKSTGSTLSGDNANLVPNLPDPNRFV